MQKGGPAIHACICPWRLAGDCQFRHLIEHIIQISPTPLIGADEQYSALIHGSPPLDALRRPPGLGDDQRWRCLVSETVQLPTIPRLIATYAVTVENWVGMLLRIEEQVSNLRLAGNVREATAVLRSVAQRAPTAPW
jgi:hypothetical protein